MHSTNVLHMKMHFWCFAANLAAEACSVLASPDLSYWRWDKNAIRDLVTAWQCKEFNVSDNLVLSARGYSMMISGVDVEIRGSQNRVQTFKEYNSNQNWKL